ncbi:MAG: hypothetical protein KAG64_05440 [Bacteroidales bacterium]|nr:hypothetical protein [Bacteroidales bacterium]
MKQFKYILIFIISLLTLNVIGQPTIDSTELKKFWNECVNPIIDNDKDKLEKIIHFPLQGEWGFMMELNKVDRLWTKQDFFDNYGKLFANDLIENLKEQSFKNIEVYNHDNGTVELLVSVGWETMIDGFKYESGIIFRFKKFKNDWKLYVIQGVG